MAINYNIVADIIDITNDNPRTSDIFLIDTNVLYWMTYTRASQANPPPFPNQITTYPSYLGKAIKARSKLYRCGLSLAELAHIIEKNEREIFNRSHIPIKTKEFRHSHASEHQNVVTEIQSAWAQVKNFATSLDILIDDSTTDSALNKFTNHTVDGYDLFTIEAISKAGVVQIITDDGDFATVPGLQVFTCNLNVIQSAKQQGKLLVR